MPIEKLKTGQVVFHFGTGDILIALAKDEGFESDPPNIILAQNETPRKIDVPQPDLIGKRETNWVVKMYFNKPKSLDALIHVLQDFKKERWPEMATIDKEFQMDKKVFCIKCKFFYGSFGQSFCCCPNNRKDNFYDENNDFIASPASRNVNNNCQDYQAEPYELDKAKEQNYKEAEKFHNKKWWQFWK